MPRYTAAALLFLTLNLARAGEPPKAPLRLPGAQLDRSVRLPNSWTIRPAGVQVELGDFPVNLALHPDRRWLAALHAGYGTHEIQIVELGSKPRVRSRVTLPQTFQGLVFAPDGKTLYASGGEFESVHAFDFADGFLTRPREIKLSDTKFLTAGLASQDWGHPGFSATTLRGARHVGHLTCSWSLSLRADR